MRGQCEPPRSTGICDSDEHAGAGIGSRSVRPGHASARRSTFWRPRSHRATSTTWTTPLVKRATSSRAAVSYCSRPRRRASTGTATGRSDPTTLPERCASPRLGDATIEPGAWEEIRTPDLRITNALLYRLSYPGARRKTTRLRLISQSIRPLVLHQRQHQVIQQQRLVDVE